MIPDPRDPENALTQEPADFTDDAVIGDIDSQLLKAVRIRKPYSPAPTEPGSDAAKPVRRQILARIRNLAQRPDNREVSAHADRPNEQMHKNNNIRPRGAFLATLTAMGLLVGFLGASASGNRTLEQWDVVTDQELLTLKGHAGFVMSVAFSPDGNRLASASFDKTLKLWDAATNPKNGFSSKMTHK